MRTTCQCAQSLQCGCHSLCVLSTRTAGSFSWTFAGCSWHSCFVCQIATARPAALAQSKLMSSRRMLQNQLARSKKRDRETLPKTFASQHWLFTEEGVLSVSETFASPSDSCYEKRSILSAFRSVGAIQSSALIQGAALVSMSAGGRFQGGLSVKFILSLFLENMDQIIVAICWVLVGMHLYFCALLIAGRNQ